ncbi:hypothetical protein BdWA1_000314 [Babesia duncani]|uniref:Uncharacterized protein n=1 Tax=Babesia duncani TaxID=323732 RepID=A0AAD9PLZ0_9APIC|nr:hypothetical protein BdWA1_000314 [Babesia duncani]
MEVEIRDDVQYAYRELGSEPDLQNLDLSSAVIFGPNRGHFVCGLVVIFVAYIQLACVMNAYGSGFGELVFVLIGFVIIAIQSFLINTTNPGEYVSFIHVHMCRIKKDTSLDDYLENADLAKLVVINDQYVTYTNRLEANIVMNVNAVLNGYQTALVLATLSKSYPFSCYVLVTMVITILVSGVKLGTYIYLISSNLTASEYLSNTYSDTNPFNQGLF